MNNGKLCVSVCAETTEELLAKVRQAEEFADVIEVRFDCLSAENLSSAIRSVDSKCPLIATFRGETDRRLEFWSSLERKFWAVDLEEDIAARFEASSMTIVSFHDNVGVPAALSPIAEPMLASPADAVKIAVTAHDCVDGLSVWKLLGEAGDVVPIAMGDAGKWTRILGLAHGAYLTYASLDAGSETAAGQITAREMVEVYRVKELDMDTKVYGVIGDPVSGSRSPYIHNAAFASTGLNNVFLHLQVKDLAAFMTRMVKPQTRDVELNFRGFSVTMPHKQAIIEYLDNVDPTAEAIGAVNTVRVDEGNLTGFNTDAHGFLVPLKKHFGEIKDARVAVAGAGGAAKAVVHSLLAEGAGVTLLARDVDKARAAFVHLGDRLTFRPLSAAISDKGQASNFDVIVNATPVGMTDDRPIFNADQLSGVKFIYDLVTRPDDTPLVAEAKKAAVPAIGGLEMLIAQAEMQFEIWTGERPPAGLMMRTALSRM